MILDAAYIAACVVSGRHVVAFMIGEKGGGRIRDWLAILSDESTPSARSLLQIAAEAADSYFDQTLGKKLVSWRVASVWLAISTAVTSLIITITTVEGSFSRALEAADSEAVFFTRIVIVVSGVFVTSFLSFVATRILLKWTRYCSSSKAIWYLFLQAALAYAFIIVTMNFTFSTIALSDGLLVGYFFDTAGGGGFKGTIGQLGEAWTNFFLSYTFDMVVSPWRSGDRLSFGETNLLYYAFPAALPSVIYVVAVGFAWMVDTLRRQDPESLHVLMGDLDDGNPNALAVLSDIFIALVRSRRRKGRTGKGEVTHAQSHEVGEQSGGRA